MVRWLVAVPLMVVSMFAPWFGQVVLSVWWFDTPAPFWAEFEDRLAGAGWLPLYLPTFVLTWFLIRRTRLGSWPVACLVVSCPLLAPGTLFGSELRVRGGGKRRLRGAGRRGHRAAAGGGHRGAAPTSFSGLVKGA